MNQAVRVGTGLSAQDERAISALLICQGVAVTSLGWSMHALSLGFVLQAFSNPSLWVTIVAVRVALTHFPRGLPVLQSMPDGKSIANTGRPAVLIV